LLLLALSTMTHLGCKRAEHRDDDTKAPSANRSSALDDDDAKALDDAATLARGMLRYDLIAWWATDALLDSGFDASRLQGWLVSPGQTSQGEARMLGELAPGELGVIAIVSCDLAEGPSSCVVDEGFEPRVLDAEELEMNRVLDAAQSHPFFRRVQPRYNAIILRGSDHGVNASWVVYIVAATTDPNEVPVGLHYRFDVSSKGPKIVPRRASHRTPITPRLDAGPSGAAVAMLMTTAIYDARPSEFQMYVSGLWAVPLAMVGCDGSVWTIEGLSAAQVEKPSGKSRCVNPWKER
jgi:hypothetical protein